MTAEGRSEPPLDCEIDSTKKDLAKEQTVVQIVGREINSSYFNTLTVLEDSISK